MKKEILEKLEQLEKRLRQLKKVLVKLKAKQVSKKAIRHETVSIADVWVEKIRSPLEYKFKLPQEVIARYAESFKRLYVLSRPNNLKSSYIKEIDKVLKGFKDDLVLPVRQLPVKIETQSQLSNILQNITNPEESEYLKEAIDCGERGLLRVAIVLGWCAVIDRIQKKIEYLGFQAFNKTSSSMRSQTSGKFRKWNKEFRVTTLSELQEILDKDLISILEAMNLLDGNQADRLRTCFQLRNQCAHPGKAPVKEPNLVVFFSDVNEIILVNRNFTIDLT